MPAPRRRMARCSPAAAACCARWAWAQACARRRRRPTRWWTRCSFDRRAVPPGHRLPGDRARGAPSARTHAPQPARDHRQRGVCGCVRLFRALSAISAGAGGAPCLEPVPATWPPQARGRGRNRCWPRRGRTGACSGGRIRVLEWGSGPKRDPAGARLGLACAALLGLRRADTGARLAAVAFDAPGPRSLPAIGASLEDFGAALRQRDCGPRAIWRGGRPFFRCRGGRIAAGGASRQRGCVRPP